ncbi:hypothetical protein ACHAWF_000884 [Thalassiosira exigua]
MKQSRRFRVTPQKFTCTLNVTPHDDVSETILMKCVMVQLPMNASDAITGHKLQGPTKDQMIVYAWNKSTNWIYIVMSRIRTGLWFFAVRTLKLHDIKPPSKDFLDLMERMRNKAECGFRRWKN